MRRSSRLDELYRLRSHIDQRIQELEAAQKKQKGKQATQAHFPLQGGKVLSIQIVPFIRRWIDEGNTLVALAEEAGVNEKTLRNMLTQEHRYTYDSIADRIMTALGYSHTNELDIEPPDTQYWED